MDMNDNNEQGEHERVTNNPQTEREQQVQEQTVQKQCHGNRRNQRFRRRCCKRGMKPKKIERQLKNRNRMMRKRNRRVNVRTNIPIQTNELSNPKTTIMTNPDKRKRDLSSEQQQQSTLLLNSTISISTSSISALQPSLKKIHRQHTTMANPLVQVMNNNVNLPYQRPMYLERSAGILFQMLNPLLNYSLKKNEEQTFILRRLELLDEQFCLIVDQQLWQSYLDIARQHHRWPDPLHNRANSTDFDLCQQYLINYMQAIETRLNQCQAELNAQTQAYPIVDLTLDRIDQGLKTFVDGQRNYLSVRNNQELLRFKDNIHGQDLFHALSTHVGQNDIWHRIIALLQRQAVVLEELLMLEMRILCKFLPDGFDQLENVLTPIYYSSVLNNQKAVQLKNKCCKIVQEAKRACLNVSLHAYELKLRDYDQQYESEIVQLKSHLLSSIPSTDNSSTSLSNILDEYMIYYTNQLKENTYKKTTRFRAILLQRRRRRRSSSTKRMIGVSPEPYLDYLSNPFGVRQWNQMSLGPLFIRSNQSAIRPRYQQTIEINREHQDIYNKMENYQATHPPYLKRTEPILHNYSTRLLKRLNHAYSAPIPYKDQILAIEQRHIATSIRRIIKTHNLIIRVTDKGHNFYIGLVAEFEEKVRKFFLLKPMLLLN